MSRWKIMSIVLTLGLGIGCIVPTVTAWWYDKNYTESTLKDLDGESVLTREAPPKDIYHFGLEQGILSVIEGKLGTSGKVIVTGLNVEAWPNEILQMAPNVEFYSLDEVQSFIDTVNEPELWQE
ncbi:hypothetical protein UF75_1044 [Desulfosporosinus sp. I2]|uniref:hypothetical protein n=1 Tax=Desulfosporosinus sp. I2 TaxID=1617025 RepID=UPI0005EE3463|nr:hypothetical protein [Desulfosporosinus sp. I2]KJR48516.1 hypothetical protein UF75_1044 [Desulfosporosinus sp. I2]